MLHCESLAINLAVRRPMSANTQIQRLDVSKELQRCQPSTSNIWKNAIEFDVYRNTQYAQSHPWISLLRGQVSNTQFFHEVRGFAAIVWSFAFRYRSILPPGWITLTHNSSAPQELCSGRWALKICSLWITTIYAQSRITCKKSCFFFTQCIATQ